MRNSPVYLPGAAPDGAAPVFPPPPPDFHATGKRRFFSILHQTAVFFSAFTLKFWKVDKKLMGLDKSVCAEGCTFAAALRRWAAPQHSPDKSGSAFGLHHRCNVKNEVKNGTKIQKRNGRTKKISHPPVRFRQSLRNKSVIIQIKV